MKRLLLDACHRQTCYKAVQKRYRTILTQGERELLEKGQRGKVAKSDAHNLWDGLKKWPSLILLLGKVKQKVSRDFKHHHYDMING